MNRRLLEVSIGLLHKAAKGAMDKAKHYENLAANADSPLKAAVLRQHAEHAYKSQAARFINRANKKAGRPYKDLSHEAVHAQDPHLAAQMRAHREARTKKNQFDAAMRRMNRRKNIVLGGLGALNLGSAALAYRRSKSFDKFAGRLNKGVLAGLGAGSLATVAAATAASRHKSKHKESNITGACKLAENGFVLLRESNKGKRSDTRHVIRHVSTSAGANVGAGVGGALGTAGGIAAAALASKYFKKHPMSLKNLWHGRVGLSKHPFRHGATVGSLVGGGVTAGTIGGAIGGGVVGRKFGKYATRDRD